MTKSAAIVAAATSKDLRRIVVIRTVSEAGVVNAEFTAPRQERQ